MSFGNVRMYVDSDVTVWWQGGVLRPVGELWTELVFPFSFEAGRRSGPQLSNLRERITKTDGVVGTRVKGGKIIAIVDAPPDASNADIRPVGNRVMQRLAESSKVKPHVNPRRRMMKSNREEGGWGW